MTLQQRFWEITCSYRPLFHLITLFTLALLVLSMIPIWLGGMDTGAIVITSINIVLVIITMLLAGYVLWRCSE